MSYTAEYQKLLERDVARGIRRGRGFVVGNPSEEEYAREMLAIDWEIEHGHSYRVECPDPPIDVAYEWKTGRRFLRIDWSMFLPWVGDKFRWLAMQRRIRASRRAGLVNPYRVSKP